MTEGFKRLLTGAVYSAAFIGFSAPALAQLTPAQQQAVDRQTGIANPGRADQRLGEEGFKPRVEPKIEVRKLEAKGAPEGAEDIKFTLTGITLENVTAYTKDELQKVYAAELGTTISLADLYRIAADLTRKYRNDGYILTQVVVPPQTIEGGTARLQVVEGRIDKIEVRDEEGTAAAQLIRDYAGMVKKNGAMNAKDLERALLLVNDLPGVTARSILNPSSDTVGAADLVIIIERKSYDAQISLDNHGTRYLGPVQAGAAISLNSWLGRNEQITAQYVAALSEENFSDLHFGQITYQQPVGKQGTEVEFLFSHIKTEPGYTLEQFDVRGWSTTMSAELSHPFIRTRSTNLTGRAMFDFQEIVSKNNIPVDPTREDHIRALRLGGKYEFIDNMLGVAYNVIDLEATKGLDILGANKQTDQNKSRPAAEPGYTKLALELQRLQRLTSSVNMLLGFTGQLSDGPLLSAEEFGVGGMNYGRGYDASEIIGDEGIAGKIEVQWQEPIDLSPIDTYQLYGFYDAGRVWNDDATTSDDKKSSIVSVGLGVRADLAADTSAGVMMAFPLTRTPETQNDRDARFYANISHRF